MHMTHAVHNKLLSNAFISYLDVQYQIGAQLNFGTIKALKISNDGSYRSYSHMIIVT